MEVQRYPSADRTVVVLGAELGRKRQHIELPAQVGFVVVSPKECRGTVFQMTPEHARRQGIICAPVQRGKDKVEIWRIKTRKQRGGPEKKKKKKHKFF